ncbi:MAG: N-acetyltransferase family protein [Myxococcota bacterium]
MRIREGRSEDLPRLLEIYNHYVEHTHITFDTLPVSLEAHQTWFEAFSEEGPYRLLVSESNGHVSGYASSCEFRAKPAYARSVEMSIYLGPDDCGAGSGSALYARLLEVLEEEATVHRAYGGVSLPNEASIALHQRFGFKRVATFSEVGFKFGRYWDVAWFERVL